MRVLTCNDCAMVTVGDLLVGGSVGHGDGLLCPFGATDVVVYRAGAEEGETMIVCITSYAMEDDGLVEVDQRVYRGVAWGDPLLDRAYALDCGNLTLDG